ncbi:hypothetical protein D3C71_782120 [compost metagenome]
MLAGGQGGEGLTPVGHVGDDPRQLDGPPRARADQPTAQQQPSAAVLDLIFGGVFAVALERARQGRGATGQVFGLQLAGEVVHGEGRAAGYAQVFARPAGQPEALSRQAQFPIADPARVDDRDQLVALTDHGGGQGQEEDDESDAGDPDGQYQGRGAERRRLHRRLDRGHRQGRHGDVMHADYGQSQDQGRRQSPPTRTILFDGEQGRDRGEQGDGRRQGDRAGRIGQGRRGS